MWNQEKSDRLLAAYGADSYLVDRFGNCYAVVGGSMQFKLEGEHIMFGPSDFDIAQEAIATASATASAKSQS